MTRAAWLPFQCEVGSGWLCSFGILIEAEGETPGNDHDAHTSFVPLLHGCKGREESRTPGEGERKAEPLGRARLKNREEERQREERRRDEGRGEGMGGEEKG